MFQNPQPPRVIDEPLIGYRSWILRQEDGALFSHAGYVPWPATGLQATCVRHVKAPELYCTCGLYLAATNDWLVRNDGHAYWRDDATAINGVCKVWGKVIQYEHGFRAEYARPYILYYTARNIEFAQRASRLYTAILEPRPQIEEEVNEEEKQTAAAQLRAQVEKLRAARAQANAEKRAREKEILKQAKERGL